MKKIMILGAGVYQLPLIQKASQLADVIIVAPEVPEKVFQYAYKVFELDVRDKEEILKLAKKEKIKGIITDQTDIPVKTVAYVAEEMGLPGIGYNTSCLFTNKYMMREKLKKLNIPVLPYRLVKTTSEAKKFFNEIDAPMIIKPVDNQGSRGLFRITSQDEIDDCFEESLSYSSVGQVVLEKYASGREFVVEALSYNNKYKELILGDTIYFDNKEVFSAKRRVFPSEANKELVKKVSKLNEQIIKGFELKQGISHSEYIMDGNELYLIETAARGGGVFISSDLISLCTGLQTEEFLVKMALGELEQIPKIEKDLCHAGYIAFYLPEGIVKRVEGVEKIKALKYVHRHLLDEIYVGLKTKPMKDKTSRYSIIVSGQNRKELEKNIKYIKDTLIVDVETNDGIQNPIWE